MAAELFEERTDKLSQSEIHPHDQLLPDGLTSAIQQQRYALVVSARHSHLYT
jgi:hypothetical protein